MDEANNNSNILSRTEAFEMLDTLHTAYGLLQDTNHMVQAMEILQQIELLEHRLFS